MSTLLRRAIREILQEAADATAAETAEHRALEKQPVQDENLMSKGDATYEAFIKKYPAAKSGLEAAFAAYESARRKRIQYLKSEFSQRFKELQEKLGNTGKDPEEVKKAMIARLEVTKLMMGTYGTDIKANYYSPGVYDAGSDQTSGWAKSLSSKGKSTAVAAYAPAFENLVISAPPQLSIDQSGAVSGVVSSPELEKIYEHELIHAEDWAIDALDNYGGRIEGTGTASDLALQLVRKAMIPEAQLTAEFLMGRLEGSKSLAEAAELYAYVTTMEGLTSEEIKDPITKKLFSVAAISSYAAKVSELAIQDHVINYNTLNRLIGKRVDDITDAATRDDLDRKLFMTISGKGKVKLESVIKDLINPSHLRITLSMMRPHLVAALDRSKDSNTVIESTLSGMRAAGIEEDTFRAAFILAITDPTKRRDLTLVAMGTAPTKGTATGDEASQSALAERWARLAGLLQG
jgi:hypothetical protein